MIRTLQFLLLLTAFIATAQDEYDFDYTLEYEYVATGLPNHKLYVFVNSKDNTSRLNVWEEKDILVLKLSVVGRAYYNRMLRENFFVESIALRCPPSSIVKNEYRVKDYKVIKLQDTVINTQKLNHYILKPVNEKKIKRKQLLIEHFIIAQHPDFEAPSISKTDPTYAIWEAYGKIPQGIMQQHYHADEAGNKVLATYLGQVIKATKYISLYKSCR
ncbi:MAG: hypothetical protein EOO45_05095 [Flavobacterium sp.]|nr:MAG: hypothetical protein EOO45_05095 [Flavobacterium sp.]